MTDRVSSPFSNIHLAWQGKTFSIPATRVMGAIKRMVVDDIIPRDARSGSATEAGVIEFIDFHLAVEETPERDRVQWRGGLRWLKARPLVHSHVHKAGDATESDHFEVPKWTAQRPHPRLCANLEPPTDGAAPHLAAGPAHGQASLLAPGALLALGPVQSSIVQPSGQIDICRRVLFSDRRARAQGPRLPLSRA